MELKDRIYLIRTELALSQRAFANKLGIAQSTVCALETGEANGRKYATLICNTFHVNQEWLLNGTGEKYFFDRDTKEVLESYKKLCPEYKYLLKKIINDMLETQSKIRG